MAIMKTFDYYPKSVLKGNITEIVAGIALIVVPIVYPFGLRIGSTRILGPTPTAVILIIAGLYLLYLAYSHVREAKMMSAKSCQITVDDTKVTYPKIRKGNVEMITFNRADVSETNYTNDDGILTVKLKNGDEIFFELENFGSIELLREFDNLLRGE